MQKAVFKQLGHSLTITLIYALFSKVNQAILDGSIKAFAGIVVMALLCIFSSDIINMVVEDLGNDSRDKQTQIKVGCRR